MGREGEQLAPGALVRHGALLVVVGALIVPVEAVAILTGARLVPHRRLAGILIVVAAIAGAALRLVFLRTGEPPDGASEAYREGYAIGVLGYWATGLALLVPLAVHYASIEVTDAPRQRGPQPHPPAIWRRVAAWLTDLTVAVAVGLATALLGQALGAPGVVVGLLFLGGAIGAGAAIAVLARTGGFDPTPGKRLVGVRVERAARRRAVVRAPNYSFRALLAGAGLVVPAVVVVLALAAVISASEGDPAADAAAEFHRGMVAGCTESGWPEAACACMADRVVAEGLRPEIEATTGPPDPNSPLARRVRAMLAECYEG